ncbi:hypothetical protein B9479_000306 [Cryptococcus floricola]|uniref:Major facilitator superfamily (MFS) profile domain-containing protein n=1 Tax=Cryptococcus floricola TaxID=2591691 RepID=A0A5D3B7S5_9TREE|nr:hypothetical protein B9479_000306 [Cryptococcus floricola]
MAPAGLEVTMVSRHVKGLSEIHQFGAYQIAFAVATSMGTIVGGQLYVRLEKGWTAVIWFAFGSAIVSMPLYFFFSGNQSMADGVV